MYLLQADTISGLANTFISAAMPIHEKVIIGLVFLLVAGFIIFLLKLVPLLVRNANTKMKEQFDLEKLQKNNEYNEFVATKNNMSLNIEKIIEKVTLLENDHKKYNDMLILIKAQVDKLQSDSEGKVFYNTYIQRERETRLMLCKIAIYNPDLDLIDRLEAFNTYISFHGNHNTLEYGKKLIIEDKKLWWHIYDKLGCESNLSSDIEYYCKVIENIKVYLS